MKTRTLIQHAALALSACALATTAMAQEKRQIAPNFPSKPIKMMTTVTAGGGLDFITRTVATKMSENLPAPVLVENVSGANGILAGSRSFSTNGAANGVLLVLTPQAQGTHADPAANGVAPWPTTGYNQNNDIMQPSQVVGNRLNASDAAVLNNAFGWAATGIRINVVNVGGTLDAADMQIMNNAVAAVNAFWPAVGNSPVFTWSVAEVPEPATWTFMVIGIAYLGASIRRRTQRVTPG